MAAALTRSFVAAEPIYGKVLPHVNIEMEHSTLLKNPHPLQGADSRGIFVGHTPHGHLVYLKNRILERRHVRFYEPPARTALVRVWTWQISTLAR